MIIFKVLSLPSSQCKTNLKATELQNIEFQQTIEELNIQLKRRVSECEFISTIILSLLQELEKNQFSDVEKTTDGHLRQLKTNNIELEARCDFVVFALFVSTLGCLHQGGHYDEGEFFLEE